MSKAEENARVKYAEVEAILWSVGAQPTCNKRKNADDLFDDFDDTDTYTINFCDDGHLVAQFNDGRSSE